MYFYGRDTNDELHQISLYIKPGFEALPRETALSTLTHQMKKYAKDLSLNNKNEEIIEMAELAYNNLIEIYSVPQLPDNLRVVPVVYSSENTDYNAIKAKNGWSITVDTPRGTRGNLKGMKQVRQQLYNSHIGFNKSWEK